MNYQLMSRFELLQTEDSYYTVRDKYFNETFHSIYGSYNESMYVYINQAYNLLKYKPKLYIFEMGFGTGLNSLLTLINKTAEQMIYYVTIDKYPLPEVFFDKLINSFKNDMHRKLYSKILYSEWNKEIIINDKFIILKVHEDINQYKFNLKYDVVYYDAFSPKTQPELWTTEIFCKIYNFMNNESILVTYSSSGIVKKALLQSNFIVERISGPIGKRHIIRAYKKF
jgi:tRNA U34 5-methylaminomethyl-2-thiouridine-forming methyltransferase MnmC